MIAEIQTTEPVLTPNHFLIGQSGGDVAPENVDYTPFNPKKGWRRVQELIRQTWKRWMQEYLTSLGSRSNWFNKQDNVKKGDMVLAIDPGTPRRQWKLGKIEAVYPGKDGNVRVVDVRENDKIYRRSLDAYRHWNFEIIRRRITRNPGGGDFGAKANS